jgi:hypothetical protein
MLLGSLKTKQYGILHYSNSDEYSWPLNRRVYKIYPWSVSNIDIMNHPLTQA